VLLSRRCGGGGDGGDDSFGFEIILNSKKLSFSLVLYSLLILRFVADGLLIAV